MKVFQKKLSWRSVAIAIIMCLSAFIQACDGDNFNKTIQNELTPVIPFLPADSGPVPGNGGLITIGGVTTTQVQIFWTEGEDGQTPQDELEYQVYRSRLNNISTPALAVANGEAVLSDWTPNIATAVSSGLAPGTPYYFNVVVRDGSMLTAAYITVSITTQSDGSEIYMFSTGAHNGNLITPAEGSNTSSAAIPLRTNIDSICAAARTSSYPLLPCTHVRAFISVSSNDNIATMPANYAVPSGRKIVGPTGIQIGENWSDLLDESIDVTLQKAMITSDQWWSGSLRNGTFDADNNCNGWSSTSGKGQSGLHNKTNLNWLEGNTPSCDSDRVVLCICW